MFGYKRLDDEFELIRSSSYVSAAKLASLSGVTGRTIRSDVAKINDALAACGAHIDMKRGSGYHLVITDDAAYQNFLNQAEVSERDLPDLSSSDERIRFLLRQLLETDDYLSSAELADMVYVGDNTLQNYLHQIRGILSTYNLTLQSKPSVGLAIVGREADRRTCFMEQIVIRNMSSYVTGFSPAEQALFASTDLDKIECILQTALSASGITTSDYGFKNLLMHSALTIERIQAGAAIEATENPVINPTYIALIANLAYQLEGAFGLTIPEPERFYLYQHLLHNVVHDSPSISSKQLETQVEDMLALIYENYGFDLRDDAELKHNLLAHLCSVFVYDGLAHSKQNPLLNTIRNTFPLAFEIALGSTHKVFTTEPYVLNEDELGYVALHLGAAMERRAMNNKQRIGALVVCGSGNAIAEMLRSRLETLLKDQLDVRGVVSYREFAELDDAALADIACVISTMPIEGCTLPYVQVDFTLTPQDIEAVSRLVNDCAHKQPSDFATFFAPELYLHLPARSTKTKQAVIEQLCAPLAEQHFVDETFLSSVLERETISDTGLGNNFAIPHSVKPISTETKVAVAILDKPVAWSNEAQDVRIVFLLAMHAGEYARIEHLYDLLLEVTNNRTLQQSILATKDFDSFMNVISELSL